MEPLLSTSGWLPGSKPQFIALLPPVPTIRFRSEPRFPTNESLAEFGHYIVTSLHDYSDTAEEKDLSTAFTTEPLAHFNQHAINRAIQDLARESAVELARSLVPRLKAKFEDRIVTSNPEQIHKTVKVESSFVEKIEKSPGVENAEAENHAESRDKTDILAATLPDFQPDDPSRKAKQAKQAKTVESQVVSEFQVDSMLARKLSLLASHDIIVLADNCDPVEWSTDRVLATQEAIRGIFKIASIKNPQIEIELHFSDDPESTSTNCFESENKVDGILERVGLINGGAVPSPLQEKILKPLAERIDKGGLQNPTVVVMITGGGENNELAKRLANVISDFKANLTHLENVPAVSFIFLSVGNDKDVGNPYGLLEQDGRIRDMVRCPKKNLKGGAFPVQLVELLVEVLDTGRD